MGAQVLGLVQKTPNQVSHEISSAESKVPSGGSQSGAQTDTVSLSQRGQAAVSQQLESSGGNGAGGQRSLVMPPMPTDEMDQDGNPVQEFDQETGFNVNLKI